MAESFLALAEVWFPRSFETRRGLGLGIDGQLRLGVRGAVGGQSVILLEGLDGFHKILIHLQVIPGNL